MDHFATRYPTNVVDIASFLVRLSGKSHLLRSCRYLFDLFNRFLPPAGLKKPHLPILHYSAPEPFTKYEICLVFAKILNLSHSHIIADAEEPKGAAAASRPRNCQLDTRETEILLNGLESGLGCSLFEEWWTDYLHRSAT